MAAVLAVSIACLGVPVPAAAGPEECIKATYKTIKEVLDDKNFDTYRVEIPDLATETKRLEDTNHYRAEDLLNYLDGLVIGIENNAHAYLLAGDWRLDAKPGLGRITQPGPVVTGGTLIHLKTPPEVTQKVIDALSKDPARRPLNYHCYEGTCKLLKSSAGITPALDSGISPVSMLTAIFKGGFVDAEGKPIEMTILATDKVKMRQRLRVLKLNQATSIKSMAKYFVAYPMAAATVIVIVGGSIYYYFDHHKAASSAEDTDSSDAGAVPSYGQ